MQYEIVETTIRGNATSLIRATNDDGSVSFIPMQDGNADYHDYLTWVSEGNTAPIVVQGSE